MRAKVPASLLMVSSLLALGAVAAGASLATQRWQTQHAARQAAEALTGGDSSAGRRLFEARGCGACHRIKGRGFATGEVAAPLDQIAGRAFLAGRLPNDPTHMVAWIAHPQAIEPGVGMPDPGLSESQARDVAAYLYTLD